MKQKVIVLLAAFSVFVVFCSCEKSSQTVVGPSPSGTNLLRNSSFESNGSPSLQGWWVMDSSDVQFVQDTPSGGGSWSIKLESVWGLPPFVPFVRSTIASPPGTHQYRFSLWAKVIGVGGSAFFMVKTPDTLITRRSIMIADTAWTSYSVLDTLTTDAGDSLLVVLSGGFSHLLPGQTFYDLCSLEELE